VAALRNRQHLFLESADFRRYYVGLVEQEWTRMLNTISRVEADTKDWYTCLHNLSIRLVYPTCVDRHKYNYPYVHPNITHNVKLRTVQLLYGLARMPDQKIERPLSF
jgi:hypothetical protein